MEFLSFFIYYIDNYFFIYMLINIVGNFYFKFYIHISLNIGDLLLYHSTSKTVYNQKPIFTLLNFYLHASYASGYIDSSVSSTFPFDDE